MKSFISLAVCFAVASAANTVATTDNECWKNQGGKYEKECNDVYFFTCDEYTVETSCNVYTFSDSRLTWFSENDLKVYFWELYRNNGTSNEAKITGKDLDATSTSINGKGKCHPSASQPTPYENGKVKNYTTGMCGFKYQITNIGGNGSIGFKVMKDSAATLLAGSALALAAVLAF